MNRFQYRIGFITPDGVPCTIVSFGTCLDDAINAIGPLCTKSGKVYAVTDAIITRVVVVAVDEMEN